MPLIPLYPWHSLREHPVLNVRTIEQCVGGLPSNGRETALKFLSGTRATNLEPSVLAAGRFVDSLASLQLIGDS